MLTTKSAALRPRTKMSFTEFIARHDNTGSIQNFLLGSNREIPSTLTLGQLMAGIFYRSLPDPVMEELKKHPFFQLMKTAGRENCPEAYHVFLKLWLCRMGIAPPEGVFTEPRGKSGRPRDKRTSMIHEKWLELGCPPLGRKTLAAAIYSAEFLRSDRAARKKMVNRCRRAVERCMQQLRLNPSGIKS